MSTAMSRLHDLIHRPGEQRLDLLEVSSSVVLPLADAQAISRRIAQRCLEHDICDVCEAETCSLCEIGGADGWCFHRGFARCPDCKGDCEECALSIAPVRQITQAIVEASDRLDALNREQRA